MNCWAPSRRDFLYGLGLSLGTAAFNALLRGDEQRRSSAGPLAPKQPHHESKAKACIYLFMEGGPSHIDTFDPKPKLDELHMQEFQRADKFISAMGNGKRYFVRSPFTFRQRGKSGLWMCDHFEQLGELADDLCVYRGC